MDATPDSPAPIRRIRRSVPVEIRSVWPSEPRDFTPWLAENLDYLDVLDLGPLSLLGVEHPLTDTDRALDILAETGDGRRIAIENQFGRADHDHLTRGLAYAVGLQAAALVIVAEEHRPEFQAIAEYLNHAAEAVGLDDGGIGVYLVEVGVERLEDWFIPRFEVVQRPNRWLSATASSGASAAPPLANEDDFLARAEGPAREELRRILADWDRREGASKSFSSTAIACRLPKPSGRGTVAALTLYPDSIWVNGGYLDDAAAAAGAPEGAVAELIRTTWPSAAPGEKGYYWHVAEPRAEEAIAFADGLWRLWESLGGER